ncbi:MAG: hypothetical protein HOM37_16055 [Acidimicrobiaceae bacterium]|nr:hypothetical protein [Acidimicrobiaceae bacterium]
MTKIGEIPTVGIQMLLSARVRGAKLAPFVGLPLASILRVERISKTVTDEIHAHHGE